MKNPSRTDAPEGFADLSIFFPDTILRAEHLHAYADRADWRCAHTSARRTTAVGGVRADMSLSTYGVTISCDTHSISPRENQSARVYRGPCRARHRFPARSPTLPPPEPSKPPRAPAEQAQQHGAETSVLDWRRRLVCSKCGSREIDMIVTGTRRRG